MAETFLLSLEVDDNGSVKVQKFKKNVEEAGSGAEKAGKQAGEHGAAGFHLFGLAAAKAGEELGIPFRASHMLGTQVAGMAASTFPAWAAAFTGVGIAALAGGVIISKIIESHKQHQEEIQKTVSSLEGEVNALYANQHQTEGVRNATYELLLAKRDLLSFNLEEQIRTEQKTLDDLNKKLEAQTKFYREGAGAITAYRNEYGQLVTVQETGTHVDIHNEELDKQIKFAQKALALDVQLRNSYSKKPDSFSVYDDKYSTEKRLQSEFEYTKAVAALWKTQGLDFSSELEIEKAIFDQETNAKLKTMVNVDQKADYFAKRRVERETMVNKDIAALGVQGPSSELYQRSLEQTATYDAALVALSKARGDSLDQQQQYELAAFDATAAHKYATLKTEDERQAFFASNEILREAKILSDQEANYKAQLDLASQYYRDILVLDEASGASKETLLADEYNIYAVAWAKELDGLRTKTNDEKVIEAAFTAFSQTEAAKRAQEEASIQKILRGEKEQGYQQEWDDLQARHAQELAELVVHHASTSQLEAARHNQVIQDYQLEMKIAADVSGRMSNIFKTLYDGLRNHDREYFTWYKIMAEAKATINIAQGITAALTSEGPYAWIDGALRAAEGAAQLAIISRQTPEGGSSGGGGISSSPGSASGSNGPSSYAYYYEQNPNNPNSYGTGWRPGEGQNSTSDSKQVTINNNYTIHAMDSKSFERYCRDNPDAITDVVGQNIKDSGKLRTTIQNYA